MAIQTIQAGSNKLRAILVTKNCLGPGGTALLKGMTVRVPESDAYTLLSGDQAEFVTETAAVAVSDKK